MNARSSVLRMTIKELIIEIEDEEGVRSLGRALGALIGQVQPPVEAGTAGELARQADDTPKKRGRKPKATAAPEAKPARKSRRPRADAATARIRDLRAEGYFEEPRRAQDVRAALAERGHKLENGQVYATLKYMADAGYLVRSAENEERVYLYSAASRQ